MNNSNNYSITSFIHSPCLDRSRPKKMVVLNALAVWNPPVLGTQTQRPNLIYIPHGRPLPHFNQLVLAGDIVNRRSEVVTAGFDPERFHKAPVFTPEKKILKT